jgi:putative redox protein
MTIGVFAILHCEESAARRYQKICRKREYPDLLEAALACCVTMTAQMFAEKRRIHLRAVRTTVRLNREQANETVFEVKAEFDGELTAEQIEQLQTAIQNCSVRRTLSKSIRFDEAGPKSAD